METCSCNIYNPTCCIQCEIGVASAVCFISCNGYFPRDGQRACGIDATIAMSCTSGDAPPLHDEGAEVTNTPSTKVCGIHCIHNGRTLLHNEGAPLILNPCSISATHIRLDILELCPALQDPCAPSLI